MRTNNEYLYCFTNASLTLRAIENLRDRYSSVLQSVAVINLIDCWLVKINLTDSIATNIIKNLQAFLNELGVPYQSSGTVKTALARLAMGDSPVDVMNRYQVVIVAHGKPEKEEIEIFRKNIINQLGYCPQSMA